MGDVVARQYVAGIAVHWYSQQINFSVLTDAYRQYLYPDKFILATEVIFISNNQIFKWILQACDGWLPPQGPNLGDWSRGEHYSHDIINVCRLWAVKIWKLFKDINNFASGWTDWNIVLDMAGGPNWVNNVVDSPIIVNASANEFYKQPMFYALGHFRFASQ